jgi:DNA invertase Pin-like site-specific DNA recombinase
MNTSGMRAAIYLRVSRDDQTTENQRLVLERVAGHRGWLIVQTYEDQGISGAKGRDQRPAFDRVLKDAVRRKFDILMVWSIDRLGRSVLHVANALAELDAAGIRLYCDREGIDSSTPMGRAMSKWLAFLASRKDRCSAAGYSPVWSVCASKARNLAARRSHRRSRTPSGRI